MTSVHPRVHGNIAEVFKARDPELPPFPNCFYQTIQAANGTYIRAHSDVMQVMIKTGPPDRRLKRLADVEPYTRFLLPRVPLDYLRAIILSARAALPFEKLWHFLYNAPDRKWRVGLPEQKVTPSSVDAVDTPGSIIDLHSHGANKVFWSSTDTADETGLRFYVVIGDLTQDTNTASIRARVGVYGHFAPIQSDLIFEGVAAQRNYPAVDRSIGGYDYNYVDPIPLKAKR